MLYGTLFYSSCFEATSCASVTWWQLSSAVPQISCLGAFTAGVTQDILTSEHTLKDKGVNSLESNKPCPLGDGHEWRSAPLVCSTSNNAEEYSAWLLGAPPDGAQVPTEVASCRRCLWLTFFPISLLPVPGRQFPRMNHLHTNPCSQPLLFRET